MRHYIRYINNIVLLDDVLGLLFGPFDGTLRLLVTSHLLLAQYSIVFFDIIVQLEQILFNLLLFTHLNGQLHAFLHLVLPFLLFHELVHLERVAFLLSFYLFLEDVFGCENLLLGENLCRSLYIFYLDVH